MTNRFTTLIKAKVLRPLWDRLKNATASGLVYRSLFLVGLANVLFLVFYGKTSSEALGTAWVPALLFAVATLVQQWFVYQDMHEIEAQPEIAVREYGDWLAQRSEFLIRVALLFCLLLCVGKVYQPIQKLFVQVFGKAATTIFECLPSGHQLVLEHEWGPYAIGSLFAYFLLLLWNNGAISGARSVRISDPEGVGLSEQEKVSKRTRSVATQQVIMTRIYGYVLLSAFGYWYWWFVLYAMMNGEPLNVTIATLSIFGFLFFVGVASYLSFRSGFAHAVSILEANYEWVRNIAGPSKLSEKSLKSTGAEAAAPKADEQSAHMTS